MNHPIRKAMNPVITIQGLTWVCHDVSFKGCEPQHSWCADGDGFLTVREMPGGHMLFDQGDFVKQLNSNREQALAEATQHMQINDVAMFEYLGGQVSQEQPKP